MEKSLSTKTLENGCSQMLEERQELLNTIYNLRKQLQRAEVWQDKVREAEGKPAVSCQCSRDAAQQQPLLLLL